MPKVPSFMRSMTSLIVFLLVLAVIVMGLISFFKTGTVLDIFNSAFSAFVGAYLQRSVSRNEVKATDSDSIDSSFKDV